LYTVKNWGAGAVLGVSLIASATGLGAFASNPDTGRLVKVAPVAAPQAAEAALKPVDVPPVEALVAPASLQAMVSLRAAHPLSIDQNTECMAKVVYNEAANQALAGQLAVAQVVLNRTAHGSTFANDACGVINQAGQFSNARHIKIPRTDLRRWRTAVAVAVIAEGRRLAQVAPGALFFHASYVRPGWSHHHRLVARIGDQIFYR
jgi:N-acetylmuramoyl-L-alanine amidase